MATAGEGAAKAGLWHRHGWIAYAAVLFGVAGHASSEFVAKLVTAVAPIAGPEVSVWRFLIGGLALVLLALCLPGQRDLLEPIKRDGLRLLPLSLLGVTATYLLFHWALDYATVAQVATLITTAPIFVGVINAKVNRERLSWGKIVGGLGAFAGVALLVTDGVLARLTGDVQSLIGVLLTLASAVLLSGYLVFIKPFTAKYGAIRVSAVTMFPGGVALWIVVGLAWGDWVVPGALPGYGADAVAAVLVLAIYNTTLTQFLWIGGLAAVPDLTRGMYLFFLKPALAALIALAFLGEVPTWLQVLAIAVITGCVGLEALWDKAARRLTAGRTVA